MSEPIGFDLETADADKLWSYGDGFLKLAGYTDGPDSVGFTTEAEDLIKRLEAAPWIYAHNAFGYDLLVLAHIYGADWEGLTKKCIDTEILDRLDYPPMARDTGGSVDKYDLDHVAERRGIKGKTADLSALAKQYGGYDQIPAHCPEYLDYLRGDVEAIRALVRELPVKGNAYAKREHRVATKNGRMTLNGFRVDIPLLEKRIAEGEDNKRFALTLLRDDYDLPLGRFEWSGRGKDKVERWTDFDSPLSTLEGRKWLIEVWDAFGVRNPPVTETGRLSTSAQDLKPLAESYMIHPDLRRILRLMMTVTTTRTIYQTIADHLVGDRVHPMIVMRQASGRSSVTNPGLTVMGKRGGRHIERDVLLPDEGHVLISADLSQVDMRAIAGHCQDPNYMALFEPGKDAHTELAIMMTGDPAKRNDLKPIGHGANYGLGPKKMIASGFNPQMVQMFFDREKELFRAKCEWRDEIRERAAAGELLDNGFGRKMRCDPRRAYTQAPALMGQGTAADIMKEALLRLDESWNPYLRITVHDEVLTSVPVDEAAERKEALREAMTFEWRGVPILCDVSEPGENWGVVSAKLCAGVGR